MRPPAAPGQRRAAAAAVALMGTIGIAFWQWRIVGEIPLPQDVGRWNADLYTIYYQVYGFAFAAGELLPRWNPYQLAGTPLLANYNGGLLYPPNLSYALFPIHLAMGWNAALHLVLAGIFTLLCGRALALAWPAASLAAACFMLNAYFVVEHFRISYLAGLAWVPAVFLCGGRVLARPTPQRGVVLGVAVACQLLTGHAQMVVYTGYALLLAGVTYLAASRTWSARDLGRIFAALAVAAVTAALLSAAQLLATFELVRHATRGLGGLTVEQTQPWTPNLELFRQVALGSGPVAFVALFTLPDRRRPLLLVTALVLIALAVLVGLGTPVFRDGFYHLPLVRLFRWPHEMLAIGNLALALLAGIALDQALTPARASGRRSLAGGALALAAVVLARPAPLATVLACAAIALLCVLPWVGRPATATLAAWTVVALLVGERFAQPPNPIMVPQVNPAAFFAPPPFVAFLKARDRTDRVLVVKDWRRRFPITEKLGSLWGVHVVQDYEPLAPAAYHDFLRSLEGTNVDAPLFWGRIVPQADHPGWRMLDMLATRFVVVAPGVAWAPGASDRFQRVYTALDATIYERRTSLPRAYLVARHRVVSDPSAALAAVEREDFDPRQEVVVDQAVVRSGAAGAPAPDAVRFVEDTNERVVLEASASRPAVLVLADIYFPGWRVAVNDVERPLLRANFLFRGVAVAPGVHVIRFWYEPRAFEVGMAISVATVLALGAASFVWGRRGARGAIVDSIGPSTGEQAPRGAERG